MAAGASKKILMLGKILLLISQSKPSSSYCHCLCTNTGGTRFIGVYLARQLVEAGHEVTLLTRGKKPVTFQIPDDSDDSFEKYKSAVKHIACDRTDGDALKQQLSGAGFQGIEAANPMHIFVKAISVRYCVAAAKALTCIAIPDNTQHPSCECVTAMAPKARCNSSLNGSHG